MIMRGRKLVRLPSPPYRAWLRNAMAQFPIFRQAFAGALLPLEERVNVKAVFYRDRDAGDLDNYEKGFGDFLQKARIVDNDKLIASWDGSRLDLDRKNPRVEVEIEVLGVS
jgi:Holliday junction resolvase RusA-like endonuclease